MKIAVIPHEEIEALRSDLNEVKELLYKYNMCSSGEKNGDEWLSSAEAARYLGVTTRTIQNWIAKGILPVSHPGRKLRFKRSELDAFLERYTLNSARATNPKQRAVNKIINKV